MTPFLVASKMAMQTTPTALVEILLDLATLLLVMDAATLTTASRLKINGFQNTLNKERYRTEIFGKLNNHYMLKTRDAADNKTKNIIPEMYENVIKLE